MGEFLQPNDFTSKEKRAFIPQLTLVPTQEHLEVVDSPEPIRIDEYRERRIAHDLHYVDILQVKFNEVLGIVPDRKQRLKNYNPVLARWKFEQLKTFGEVQDFRGSEQVQLESVLRERYRAEQSQMEFIFDSNGKLRSKLLPDEPLEHVLERGVFHRKEQGSQEQTREVQEVRGISKIQEFLGNPSTPLGTRMVIMSGPGLVDGSPYSDNFVDDYEKTVDPQTGEVMVKATRHSSATSYADYRIVAQIVDPTYFKGEKGPIDAWLLSHPLVFTPGVFTDSDDLFDTLFEKNSEALKEPQIQQIIEYCLPYILYTLDAICQRTYDPREIALGINTMLNKGDKAFKLVKEGRFDEFVQMLEEDSRIAQEDIQSEVALFGMMQVEEILAGCGLSGGFAVGGIEGYFSNSVGMFGLGMQEEDQHGSLYFSCPHLDCKRINKRPTGILLENCDYCHGAVRCGPDAEVEKKKKLEEESRKKKEQDNEQMISLNERRKEKLKKKDDGFLVVLFGIEEEDEKAA